jgi:AraC family transcriptional activator of pobA
MARSAKAMVDELRRLPRRRAGESLVPFFSLYGHAPQETSARFVHVERVRDRLALHHGRVKAHRHPHLHQISLWFGGGVYEIEGELTPMAPAALSLVPAGTVHGCDITDGADAIVVSISDDFRRECLCGDPARLQDLLLRPALLRVDEATGQRLLRLFQDIEDEYRFAGWNQAEAIAAYLRLILIQAGRLNAASVPLRANPCSDLAGRFTRMVDEHFAARWTVERYACELATTSYLLNEATRAVIGASAAEVIKSRLITEAKRLLLYTVLTVFEVGACIGYEDPAHFVRFFRGRTGLSPSAWRHEKLSRPDQFGSATRAEKALVEHA